MHRRTFMRTGFSLAAATIAVTANAQTRGTSNAEAPAVPTAIAEELWAKSADGVDLSVRAYGNPSHPEILLIHGLSQSRLSWDRQLDALSTRFRVVTFDLRGHGDSDKPGSPDGYDKAALWADDVRAVMNVANLRKPVLVGWSLGGLIIGHYLMRYGVDHIAGVNLVNAVTKLSPDLLGPASLEYAGALASPDLAVRSAAIVNFLEACFATAPPEAEFRRMLAYNGMVPRGLQEGVVKLSGRGLDEAFGKPQHLLVTYGAQDRLTRREMSERVSALNPGAKLSIYPDAGHAPFFENPARFNAELAAFVVSAS
jgi:non-heme chloroperoxidase